MTLVSDNDLSLYLKVSFTPPIKDDALKIRAIAARCSDIIKKYTGQAFTEFYSSPKVEIHNNSIGSNIIYLSQAPVVDIVLVEEKTSDGTWIPVSDFFLDEGTNSLVRGAPWSSELGGVRVTYTSGYPDTPLDIKQAVLDLTKFYNKEEYKDSQSLLGASVTHNNNNLAGGVSKQYNFPPHIQRILDHYRF